MTGVDAESLLRRATMVIPERWGGGVRVPTWGFVLLNGDLPDQRQQRQQQSEQLLPTGQFLRVQENTMLLHGKLPRGLAPRSHPDTPNKTNLCLDCVKIFPSAIKNERLADFFSTLYDFTLLLKTCLQVLKCCALDYKTSFILGISV